MLIAETSAKQIQLFPNRHFKILVKYIEDVMVQFYPKNPINFVHELAVRGTDILTGITWRPAGALQLSVGLLLDSNKYHLVHR